MIHDLLNRRFNRLLVIGPFKRENRKTFWFCRCDCGKELFVAQGNLVSGNSWSCGCYKVDNPSNLQHGKSETLEWYLWIGAKRRALERNLPFNLELSDIHIPDCCPVLGIRLFKAGNKLTSNSPSLDRTIPELGYIKGNIAVLSHKANSLKNNGTLEDHRAIVKYLEGTVNG